MRYLTKSRFKLGLDCPTKLFYTKKLDVYGDNSLSDPFLQALADGGFQVGELAKCYYPDGIEVFGLDYKETWEETSRLLEKDNVVIFEAAILFNNLFVRVDILEKKGNVLHLIEVKSKSFNSSEFPDCLWQKKNKNKLDSKWFPYVMDIAFQSYVARLAFPNSNIKSSLMCTDKEKVASIDGLNQKFLLDKSESKTKVIKIGSTTLNDLGKPILTAVDITDAIDKIINEEEESEKFKKLGFKETVDFFAKAYKEDKKIIVETSNNCKSCEFRIEESKNVKSGFNECFKHEHGLTNEELKKPFVFDVWFTPKLKNEKILMEDIEANDLEEVPNRDGKDGLSRSQRQWLQIKKIQENDTSEYFDKDGFNRAIESLIYPLHFIDFETCMVAIPFNKGRRPYEQIAFQFSHHVLDKNNTYKHHGEWLEATPGVFPNFDFVRQLKKQLGNDRGTIFRYSNHENTVLNQIYEQLLESNEQDKKELCTWIKTITQDRDEGWVGERNMVDLCELIKSFYYHPDTHGSNSIKYVLPAILKAQGKNDDPYKDLPPVFSNYDRQTLDLLMGEDELRNGGAALTAYALMQFTQMSELEREKIKNALLRYCKLDTEAMVWIYQYLITR